MRIGRSIEKWPRQPGAPLRICGPTRRPRTTKIRTGIATELIRPSGSRTKIFDFEPGQSPESTEHVGSVHSVTNHMASQLEEHVLERRRSVRKSTTWNLMFRDTMNHLCDEIAPAADHELGATTGRPTRHSGSRESGRTRLHPRWSRRPFALGSAATRARLVDRCRRGGRGR